ncbi:MAG: hypothetical protein EAZ99_17110 [Alphaproteobacteria bacterium]|nr:MAG: hypothetical protein EAZ99_17110 [Alphaproteobacteria bacterium]
MMAGESGLVLIASFPKSGNTWVRLALASLMRGGAPLSFPAPVPDIPICASRLRFDELMGVESADLTPMEAYRLRPAMLRQWAATPSEPRILKVHDAWGRTPDGESLFPPEVIRAVVHVVRDPRDVCVSFAAHLDVSIETSARYLSQGLWMARGSRPVIQLPQWLPPWSEHVLSWTEDCPCPVLTIRFADMRADPRGTLARIAHHIGLDSPADALDRAVAATTLEAMAAAERSFGFVERQSKNNQFFGSGRVGGWRGVLSQPLGDSIREAHAAAMARVGLNE